MVAAAEVASTQRLLSRYYRAGSFPTIWCPGCGIGIVVQALVRAIDRLGLDADQVVIGTGIGCSGFIYNYLNFDAFHGAHGRALAIATGVKLANPELTVIVAMGDGDCAAIGGNHLIHAARRNADLTALVLNNETYGMTGGQYSPTTPFGARAATAPLGHLERPLDICGVAMAAGATFVARTTAAHPTQMVDLIARAIAHCGFSLVEVMTPCPVHFGRYTGTEDPAQLLGRYRRRALPAGGRAAEEPATARSSGGEPRFVTGVLHDETLPEYTAEYSRLRARATAGRASG